MVQKSVPKHPLLTKFPIAVCIAGLFVLSTSRCAAVNQPVNLPPHTSGAEPTPTRTLRPAPTLTLALSSTSTPTLKPYPPQITQDNLEQLTLLYRFNSLGFYSPENDGLILYDNNQTAIWDLQVGSPINTFLGRYKALHNDYLLTTTGNELLLWQVSTWKLLKHFEAQQGAFHPVLPWVIIFQSLDGQALVWDYQSNLQVAELDEYPQDFFAFSPQGNLLAASGGSELSVRVWSLPNLTLRTQFTRQTPAGNINTQLSFTANERYLLVAGTREQKIYDLESNQLVLDEDRVWAVFPGPDSRYAFVSSSSTTRIFDLEQRQYISKYLQGNTPAFIPEAGLIVNHTAGAQDFRLYVYQSESLEQLTALHVRQGVGGNGSVSGAGLFALPDQSGSLLFYDIGTWQLIYLLPDMAGFNIVRPQFSREGHWLLFGWYTYDEFGDYYSGFDVWGVQP